MKAGRSLSSIFLIVSVVPWTEIVPKVSPFATTLAYMGLPAGQLIMEAVVLVAVLSCLNSGLYVTSRALFGLAKHKDAPLWLVQVNNRKVPARASGGRASQRPLRRDRKSVV